MQDLLNGLLPRLYPDLAFQFLVYEGKSDLEKNIPRKLRAGWPPGVRFVVLRDNDGSDCVQLKQRRASDGEFPVAGTEPVEKLQGSAVRS